MIKNYIVVGIGLNSFTGCDYLESVVMPDAVRYVEESAFLSCRLLEKVKWSSSLESIGRNSFSLKLIKEIKLPDSLRKLGESSFSFNDKITEIVIPKNVEAIGNYALSDCDNLKIVTLLPPNMEIGIDIFSDCVSLKKVYVPKESLDYYKECFKEYDFEVLSLE
ncbi:leucine rich repeat (LRR) protein [Mobilisporobacter senegalensis]|uniref:Leucine rich repeat (LRR) protein n=1 Tax=Mobilisporobacter senegalensis TaxID=1329262 RepID=A0A3N1Y3B5_9FIRM|nr:leucine-rich repeat domain-containing protein [Mobilisporobacter senegalensis]ROR31767.1 leucine rich repeat (LRR) protein [Mobilisporobacter senegalensis]